MRVSVNKKNGGKERESIVIYDGLSALPDLLCNILSQRQNRARRSAKILFKKGIAQSSEVRVNSRV